MKRIEPRNQYGEDGGYPSVVDVEVGLSRRGFLGAALAAGGVGLGGALLLPGTAEAGRRRGSQKFVLYFRHRLPGCKHQVEKLVIQSYDRRLMAFFAKAKERPGIYAALRAVLKRYKCRDLHDTKRRGAMARGLGKALAARYRKRTRRRTTRPVVTIIAGRVRAHPPVDGGLGMPSVPLAPIA